MRTQLALRCSLVLLDRTLPLELEWVDSFPHDDVLSITGCKTFIDGTIGSRSADLDPMVPSMKVLHPVIESTSSCGNESTHSSSSGRVRSRSTSEHRSASCVRI